MKRTAKKPAKPPDQQGKAFTKAARELGCDEDEAAFDKRLRKIAQAPVKSESAKEAKPKRQK